MTIDSGAPRIPVAPEYMQALGRACYNLANLEACAIRSIEMFEAGYRTSIRQRKITAGQIGFDFLKLIGDESAPQSVLSQLP